MGRTWEKNFCQKNNDYWRSCPFSKKKKRRPTRRTYLLHFLSRPKQWSWKSRKWILFLDSLKIERSRFLEIYFGRAFLGKCRKTTYFYVVPFTAVILKKIKRLKKITRISNKNWTWSSTTLIGNQTSTLPCSDKWVLNVSMTYCHGKSFLNFKLHKILFFWWNTQFIVSNYPSDAQSLNDAKFSVASIWYEWILHAISKISWNCSVESLTWNLFTNTLALPP